MTGDPETLIAFVLVLARTSAWVMAAPIFSVRGVSGVSRIALALSLAVFLAPLQAEVVTGPTDTINLLVALVGQVVVGLVLGWATGLLLHAFEGAGTAVDMATGLSSGSTIDPVNGVPSTVFARFTNMVFIALFVVTNAHLTLVAGFVRSFDVVPASSFPRIDTSSVGALAHAVTELLLAALQIGAPVLGVLFLTEVALGVASRFAPQANVFAIGLPAKLLIGLGAMGVCLVALPAHLPGLVDRSVRMGLELVS